MACSAIGNLMKKTAPKQFTGKFISAFFMIFPILAALVVTPVFASNCNSQADGNWSAAGTGSCGQVPSRLADVTITFGSAPSPTFPGGNFSTNAATNPNTGSLSFSVISGPCVQISPADFAPSGAGSCVVQAYSAATMRFKAAYATQSITIMPANQQNPLTIDLAVIQAEHTQKFNQSQATLKQGMLVPNSALAPAAGKATSTPKLAATLKPSATATVKASATLKPSATSTATVKPTATATATSTSKPSATTKATTTPKVTATQTATPKATATITRTPSATAKTSATPAPSATPTRTSQPPSATATAQPTATATQLPTNIPTITQVPTEADTLEPSALPPDTATATLEATATAIPADPDTATPVQPDTETATLAPTETAPATSAPTATATLLPVDTETATAAPSDTATPTFIPAPTGTATQTSTASPSATASATPTNTVTATDTAIPTEVIPAQPVTVDPASLQLATTLNLKVRTTGLYRVSYETLLASGLDLAGVPSSKITLINGSQMMPVTVFTDDPAGSFGPGGYLEFYGQALDTLYTDTNIYTIQVSNAPVVPQVPALPAAPDAEASVPAYTNTLLVNNQKAYTSSAPGTDPWYDTALSTTTTPKSSSFDFTVNGLADSSVPTNLNLVVWGMSTFTQFPDHHLQVSVNGVSVSDYRFDGLIAQTLSLSLPAGTLKEGTNSLSLTLPGDTGAQSDIIYLDKFSVLYPRIFLAQNGSLKFSAAGPAFTVSNLPTPNVLVYRAGDNGMVRLASVDVHASGASFTASFSGSNFSDTYLVTTVEGINAPGIAAARISAPNLDTPAQYLIISATDFISGLTPLITARQAQGLTVNVVDVNDLYERYSAGVFNPQAIKQYISYAADKLGTQYVLLVGGDTYDYRNFLGKDSISFIPSLFTITSRSDRFIPADPLYADTNGDNVPELAIGRFPVRSSTELSMVITKTLRYQNKTYNHTALFAADAKDGSMNFKAVSAGLAASMPTGWSIQSLNLDDTSLAAARTQLISAMTGGTALITYTGHSSPAAWSYSSLFSTYDAATLAKTQMPFVVVQWGCWNNYSIDPNNTFLAQTFLLWGTDRGAAATLGASTTLDYQSQQMLASLLTPRLAAPGATLGAAVRDAKLELARTSPELSDVLLGWSLMGDPALIVQP